MANDADVTISVQQDSGMMQGFASDAKANAKAAGDGGGGGQGKYKGAKKAIGGALKGAGISFGLSSILKQSQIFTGFLGSVFQIVGGLVDVMLAPLMPIFIPVLQFLAKSIPVAAKISQFFIGSFIDYFLGIWKNFTNAWGLFKEAYSLFKGGNWIEGFKKLGQGILQLAWGIVKLYFSSIILSWGRIFLLFPGIFDLIGMAWNWIKTTFTNDNIMLMVLKGVKILTDGITGFVNIIVSLINKIIEGLQKVSLFGKKPFESMGLINDGNKLENSMGNKLELVIIGLEEDQKAVARAKDGTAMKETMARELTSAIGFTT